MVIVGIIRLRFHQIVSVIPGKKMVSEGKNIFGYNLSSVWELKEMGNGITQVHADYVIELPWFLGFLGAPLSWFLKEVRKKSWRKDQAMLERRNELLRLGFGDGGQSPKNRWRQAAESFIPRGSY